MLQIVTYHVLLDHSVQTQVLHPVLMLKQVTSSGTVTVNGVIVPSTSETACGIGTYQDQTGQSSCDDADAGYLLASAASSGLHVLLKVPAFGGQSVVQMLKPDITLQELQR